MSLVERWNNWWDEGRLNVTLRRYASILLIVCLRCLRTVLLLNHLFIYGAHELVLLIEVFADLRDLLSKLIGHHSDYLLIKLWSMLRSSGNLSIMDFLAEWRLIVNDTDSATHCSRLLLLLTVDLHNVIDDVEIVVNCISSGQDILRQLIWLLRVSVSSSWW